MTPALVIEPAAEEDIFIEYQWYEDRRAGLGVERAKTLALVLKCHPAVLVFPGWDVGSENAA